MLLYFKHVASKFKELTRKDGKFVSPSEARKVIESWNDVDENTKDYFRNTVLGLLELSKSESDKRIADFMSKTMSQIRTY